MRTLRATLVTVALVALLGGAPAIAVAQDERHEVETDVLSHPTARDIHVWGPTSDGEFPVAYAIHGLRGSRYNWTVLARQLAERGVVVFAPDYRSTDAEQGRWDRIDQDLECGYRYVREIAADHGGDLSQPVTVVGHSLGASQALFLGLDDTHFVPGGTYDECFTGAPRPGAIVGIGGCHYEYRGDWFGFDVESLGANDARVVLVGGGNDGVCAAWQSEDAAEALVVAGREATYVEVPEATHLSLIGGEAWEPEWWTRPDHPTTAVLQVILDSIAANQVATDL